MIPYDSTEENPRTELALATDRRFLFSQQATAIAWHPVPAGHIAMRWGMGNLVIPEL